MTQAEILQELKRLPVLDRLTVVETALHLIREDLQREEHAEDRLQTKQQLAAAAEALLADYASDEELTAFTVLDSEDFCAQG